MSSGGPFLLSAAFVGNDAIVAVSGQDCIAVGGRWGGGGGCYRRLRWMTDYGLKPGKSIIPGGVIARIDDWDGGEGASSLL